MANPNTGRVWSPSLKNDLGRLSQDFENRVKPQGAIDFIYFNEIPEDRTFTFANFVYDYRPLESKKFRVIMTFREDILDYPNHTAIPIVSGIKIKLLINSVISDHKTHNTKIFK